MGKLIDTDMLEAFAVIGEPQTIPEQILSRYGDIVDRTAAAYAHISKADRTGIIDKLTAA
jgi:hypothetical protein